MGQRKCMGVNGMNESRNQSTAQIVTHDPEYGLSYIYLVGPIAKGRAKKQLRASPSIILDFDENGALIGVELLRADLLHPALLGQSIPPGTQLEVS